MIIHVADGGRIAVTLELGTVTAVRLALPSTTERLAINTARDLRDALSIVLDSFDKGDK